eukprot:s7369_g1.t1
MAPKTDLLTAPIVTRAKTLSEFNKAELLEAAYARNLSVNDRWSTEELRSSALLNSESVFALVTIGAVRRSVFGAIHRKEGWRR